MIGALKATPTICLQQHDCVATLIGKASSESEGARWGGVVPRIVLVVGVEVCVRINPALYLKATDFQRGKQLKPCEQQYISQRQKNFETFTHTIPRNGVVADIDSISDKMMQHRKSCVLKRKRLEDLIEEQNKLQKELDGEEESLVDMQRKHMDILQVHLEAKKQQKQEYEMKLSRKLHTIERMQKEYEELQHELQPFIKNAQSQIEKLEKISTCTERVHAATSPSIVDAIAAADLPSLSSGNSDNSIGEHHNKTH